MGVTVSMAERPESPTLAVVAILHGSREWARAGLGYVPWRLPPAAPVGVVVPVAAHRTPEGCVESEMSGRPSVPDTGSVTKVPAPVPRRRSPFAVNPESAT